MTKVITLRNTAHTSDSFFTYTNKAAKLSITNYDDNWLNMCDTLAAITIGQISDTDITGMTTGHILVRSAGSKWVSVALSQDVTITAAGLATVGKIGNKAVTLAGALTTVGAYGVTFTFSNTTAVTFPTSGTLMTTTLTDGSILIGNVSNVATACAITGDISITNAGVTAIATGVIVNADINASAAIALSKLTVVTASKVLVSDGSGLISASTITTTQLGTLNVTAGTVAASSAVVVDSGKKVNEWYVDNLSMDTNTIASTNTDGNIVLTPNGTGIVSISSSITIAASKTITGAGALTIATVDDLIISVAGNKDLTLQSTAGGDIANIFLGRSTDKIGFFESTPVVLQTTLSITTPDTAGDTNAVYTNTKWNGGDGTTEYSIGDLIGILKAYGLLTK